MVILETVRFLKNMLQEEYLSEMEVKNDKNELKKIKQAFKKGWFFSFKLGEHWNPPYCEPNQQMQKKQKNKGFTELGPIPIESHWSSIHQNAIGLWTSSI